MFQLDIDRLIDDIKKIVDKKLDEVAQKAVEYMIHEIAILPDFGSHDSVGANDWRRDVIDAIKFISRIESLEVVKTIGLIDADELTERRGFLINYGMGYNLYRKNPFLKEYLSSEYYDSKRKGFGVYTRPGEKVYDYETGDWKISTAEGRYEIPNFYQNPSLFFETAMHFVKFDFDKAIQEIGDSIDFAKYLVNK